MSWLFIILLFGFTFAGLSEARHVKEFPSAVVVGTVFCDTCFQDDFSKTSHFISGASVAIECKDGNLKPSYKEQVRTDKHGEFRVHLPSSISKHVEKIKGCSVKLISSSEPYCAVASTASSSSLHLKSRKQGNHIFSAGFFTFKPQKQPNLCSQKPSLQDSEELETKKVSVSQLDDPTFPPPLQEPTTPELPPLNQNHLPPLPLLPGLPPLPQLPPLPPLPGLPGLIPSPGKTTQAKPSQLSKTVQLSDPKTVHPEAVFPTPPLFPPLLPPLPFQPPPSLVPPVLPSPPAPVLPFPPIPGLTPSPPPPAFPFPLPPLFPSPSPSPRFPGIPPTSSSEKTSP